MKSLFLFQPLPGSSGRMIDMTFPSENSPPGSGSGSGAGPGPRRPPLSEQNQADSFLTAARLIREGRTDEEKSRKWQFSSLRPGPAGSDGAEVQPRESRTNRVQIIIIRMTRDNKTDSDENSNGPEGAAPGRGRAERQTGFRTAGVKRKQSRRSKVTVLPVIAEL